jgi:hypothetical protein
MTKKKKYAWKRKYDRFWGTTSEKNFILGLGLGIWSKSHRVLNIRREDLLRRYLETCRSRERWGAIDREEVIKFTEGLLASI